MVFFAADRKQPVTSYPARLLGRLSIPIAEEIKASVEADYYLVSAKGFDELTFEFKFCGQTDAFVSPMPYG